MWRSSTFIETSEDGCKPKHVVFVVYLMRYTKTNCEDRPDDGGSKHLWNVVNFYQTKRRNNPEDSRRRENLKFQLI
jgi:hypothetical protein